VKKFAIQSVEQKDDDSKFMFGKCSKVEVCTLEKYCKRKGSKKTWELFQKYAVDTDIEVVESDCLDECLTGPNIRLDGKDSRIQGAIKGDEIVCKVLGLHYVQSSE
jgi:NADH:ubiquinone oxidoreductase subunit E